jgi:hypothetical protein
MDNFLDQYIRHQSYDNTLPEHRSKKVRIAVIDSGVSIVDTIIKRARKNGKIRKCRNFSSLNHDDVDDKLGHGTMVARLLMLVAPEAELFIAKVSSDGEQIIPKSKLHCIATVSDADMSEFPRSSSASFHSSTSLMAHCVRGSRLSTGQSRSVMLTSSPCPLRSRKKTPTSIRSSMRL